MAVMKDSGMVESHECLKDLNRGETTYPGAWELERGLGSSQEVVSLVSLLECLHE